MSRRALVALVALAATAAAQEPAPDPDAVIEVRVRIERALSEPARGGPPEPIPMRRALQPVVNAFAPEVELRLAGATLIIRGPRPVAEGLARLARTLDAPGTSFPDLALWGGRRAATYAAVEDEARRSPRAGPLAGLLEPVVLEAKAAVPIELLGRAVLVTPPETHNGRSQVRLLEERDGRVRVAYLPSCAPPGDLQRLVRAVADAEGLPVDVGPEEGELLLTGPTRCVDQLVRVLRAVDERSRPGAARAVLADQSGLLLVHSLPAAPLPGLRVIQAGACSVIVGEAAAIAAVTTRVVISVPVAEWRAEAIQELGRVIGRLSLPPTFRPRSVVQIEAEPLEAEPMARALRAIGSAPTGTGSYERHTADANGRRGLVLLGDSGPAVRAMEALIDRLARAPADLTQGVHWHRGGEWRGGVRFAVVAGPVEALDRLGILPDAARVAVAADVVHFRPVGPAPASRLSEVLSAVLGGDVAPITSDERTLVLRGPREAVRLAELLDDPPPLEHAPLRPLRVALPADLRALIYAAWDGDLRQRLVEGLRKKIAGVHDVQRPRLIEASELGRVLLVATPAQLEAMGLSGP